jgi:rhodanese-related sulfurtransferase
MDVTLNLDMAVVCGRQCGLGAQWASQLNFARYPDKDPDMADQTKHYENKLNFEIDSWDLKVTLEAGERVVVLDARSPESYARGHIPGAINVPHRQMSPDTTAHLDKQALIVTYCDGIGCNASTKGALNMLRLGFRVKELIGGLDWWQRDGHPVHGGGVEGAAISCGCA